MPKPSTSISDIVVTTMITLIGVSIPFIAIAAYKEQSAIQPRDRDKFIRKAQSETAAVRAKFNNRRSLGEEHQKGQSQRD